MPLATLSACLLPVFWLIAPQLVGALRDLVAVLVDGLGQLLLGLVHEAHGCSFAPGEGWSRPLCQTPHHDERGKDQGGSPAGPSRGARGRRGRPDRRGQERPLARPGGAARWRGGQHRRDAGLPRHGHRHRQAASATERRGIPHHLLDLLDVHEPATVARVPGAGPRGDRRLPRAGRGAGAGRRLGAVHAGGAGPLRVPRHRPGPAGRARGRARRARVRALHERLRARTRRPPRGSSPTNGRRVVRALEVIALTGRPYSASLPEQRYFYPAAVQVGVHIDRGRSSTSGSRCGCAGCGTPAFVDEVRRLADAGLREGRTANRALGYAQVLAFLDGEMHRGGGLRADRHRHPPVRPAPGLVVPQGPADQLGRLTTPTVRTGPSPPAARFLDTGERAREDHRDEPGSTDEQSGQLTVERKVTVHAPAERVLDEIADFHRWTAWSPWEDLDPALERRYSGPAAGPGSVTSGPRQPEGRGRPDGMTDGGPGRPGRGGPAFLEAVQVREHDGVRPRPPRRGQHDGGPGRCPGRAPPWSGLMSLVSGMASSWARTSRTACPRCARWSSKRPRAAPRLARGRTDFWKGHGTENDFVLLADPDGTPSTSPPSWSRRSATAARASAATACSGRSAPRERRPGGRSRRGARPSGSWTTATPTARSRRCAATASGCFARYLVDQRASTRATPLPVGTRAGVKVLTFDAGRRRSAWTWASPDGARRDQGRGRRPVLAGAARLDGQPARGRLRRRPRRGRSAAGRARHDPAVFPDGVNVEFVVRRGDRHVAMRVHERGVGGDPLVRHRRLRRDGRRRWPTGTRPVRRTGSTSPAGRSRSPGPTRATVLTGPAVLVASGTVLRSRVVITSSVGDRRGRGCPESPGCTAFHWWI